MKRYLAPVALILALGLGVALAQNITKSIQLSQQPGVIGMDTGNNVYFPAHVLSLGKAPAVSSCGGGSPAITGTDFGGVITMGTSATGCTLTFAKAYVATPWCVVTSQTSTATPVAYTPSLTTLTETQVSTSSNLVNYICIGAQ